MRRPVRGARRPPGPRSSRPSRKAPGPRTPARSGLACPGPRSSVPGASRASPSRAPTRRAYEAPAGSRAALDGGRKLLAEGTHLHLRATASGRKNHRMRGCEAPNARPQTSAQSTTSAAAEHRIGPRCILPQHTARGYRTDS